MLTSRRKEVIFSYIEPIRDIIYKTYRGIRDINVSLTQNFPSDNQQVDFEIHVKGTPTRILEDEETFHSLFFKKVPEDKQKFFVFTYNVAP